MLSRLFLIKAALGDRLVRPLPPSTSPIVNGSEMHEMQVDYDPEREVLEGRHKEFLKVDGGVLERGLRELIPSLCAYLRGHTEVRLNSVDIVLIFVLCFSMLKWIGFYKD